MKAIGFYVRFGSGYLRAVTCERCQKDVAVSETTTFGEALDAIAEHLAEHLALADEGGFAVVIRFGIKVAEITDQ